MYDVKQAFEALRDARRKAFAAKRAIGSAIERDKTAAKLLIGKEEAMRLLGLKERAFERAVASREDFPQPYRGIGPFAFFLRSEIEAVAAQRRGAKNAA
jgi:predicted DNA-binding transcriptional regulator AlpA